MSGYRSTSWSSLPTGIALSGVNMCFECGVILLNHVSCFNPLLELAFYAINSIMWYDSHTSRTSAASSLQESLLMLRSTATLSLSSYFALAFRTWSHHCTSSVCTAIMSSWTTDDESTYRMAAKSPMSLGWLELLLADGGGVLRTLGTYDVLSRPCQQE